MTELEKKFLDKVPIDKIYEDLFQPGMKKAGQALETVIEFGLTILLPIKLLNEKAKLRLKSHLDNYNKKLETIEEEKICAVPEHIGLPIIDKLTYLNQGDLSEGFIRLLTKASSLDTVNLVHPGFLDTLNNLCADEAKILNHFRSHDRILSIDLHVRKYDEKIPKPDFADIRGPKTREQLKQQTAYAFQERNEVDLTVAWNLTGIEKLVQLDFPKNIDIYLDNLLRQGLIKFERGLFSRADDEEYLKLEQEIYADQIKDVKAMMAEVTDQKTEFFVARGFIAFTDYGKAFKHACVID